MNQNAPATLKFWVDMDPELIGLWTYDAKVIMLVAEASNINFRMRSSGFHHLCVKMRLRRANSGIDMDQQLIDSLRKSGAKTIF